MVVSPSPLELYARLSDDEKVAVDLFLEEAPADDARLLALVPAEGRRGYLRTLAMQLPACASNEALDADVAAWTDAHARHEKRLNERLQERAEERAEALAVDRTWLATLSGAVRKSVERQRRRRAARRGR
jgi:hypothetical protein